MTETTSVQWFPGHMAKTKRLIKASLPLVDAVAEITDARVPASSRNPDLNSLIGDKPRIVVLNKCDCADENAVRRWIEWYKSCGIAAVAVDCKSGKGINRFVPEVKNVLKPLIERHEAKGYLNRPLRVMVVGIPNVGKSTFINRLAGQKKAKAENRPGVTLDKQWVKIGDGVDLLDMPGVLWPKFEDKIVGERLAFTGAVKDTILDTEALAARLLLVLNEYYPAALEERFKIKSEKCEDGYALLEMAGRGRGMLISGGEVNTERAAFTVLEEYRGGKLGRLTLEFPPEKQ